MENVTLTSNTTSDIITLNPNENVADKYFSFVQDNKLQTIDIEDEEDLIEQNINNQIEHDSKVLSTIKKDTSTSLSDEQLLDMYNNMFGDGMIIF